MTPLEELTEYCGEHQGAVTLSYDPVEGLFMIEAVIYSSPYPSKLRCNDTKYWYKFMVEATVNPGTVLNQISAEMLEELRMVYR